MATASFSGAYGQHIKLIVTWRQTRQDARKNQTTGTVTVDLRSDAYGAIYWQGMTKTLQVTVNGTTQAVALNHVSLSQNGSVRLLTRDYTITHEADGTKGFTLSARLDVSISGYGVAETREAIRLTPIPRSSQVSLSGSVIGESCQIRITRQATSYKHTLRYEWFGKTGVIASNIDTQATWTIPVDFADNIPDSTTGSGKIYLDTYNGTSKLGTQTVTFTASVPESMKPSLSSVSLIDSNAVVRNLALGLSFVQILSDIQVNFSGASGVRGSTIRAYRAEIVGKNQATTENGGRLGMMNYSGTQTIRAVVVDSRGRESPAKEVTVTVMPYKSPVLNFSLSRVGATQSTLQVRRNASISPLTVAGSQKNKMTLSFRVAEAGSQTFTTDNGSASGEWLTQSQLTNSLANLSGTYPPNKSYVVIGKIEDRFTSFEFQTLVGTEVVPISYGKNRVGFGKIASLSDAVDSDWRYYYKGKEIQNHQLTQHDGNIFHYPSGKADLNNQTKSGFFSCNEPLNSPLGEGGQFYVAVYSESSQYLTQTAIQKSSNRFFIRTRGGTTWTNWVEYAGSNHTNLINTGWVAAGFPGSYYKRVGDVLSVRYDFLGTGDNMVFATIPASVFRPVQAYMLPLAEWTTNGSANGHVQINKDSGNLHLMASKARVRYCGQLTIMI